MRLRSIAFEVTAALLVACSLGVAVPTAQAAESVTVTVTDGTASTSRSHTVAHTARDTVTSVRRTYKEKGVYVANGRRYTMTGIGHVRTTGSAARSVEQTRRVHLWVRDGVGTCTRPTQPDALACAQSLAREDALAKVHERWRAHYAAELAADKAFVKAVAERRARLSAISRARAVTITSRMVRDARARARADGVRRAEAYAAKVAATPTARAVPAAVNATNRERVERGLVALPVSSCAQRYADAQASAQARAQRMHHTASLSTVLQGCPGSHAVGENVAYGFPDGEAVVEGWMSSPGHRATILSDAYTHVAVAVAYDVNGRPYYAQVFLG